MDKMLDKLGLQEKYNSSSASKILMPRYRPFFRTYIELTLVYLSTRQCLHIRFWRSFCCPIHEIHKLWINVQSVVIFNLLFHTLTNYPEVNRSCVSLLSAAFLPQVTVCLFQSSYTQGSITMVIYITI